VLAVLARYDIGETPATFSGGARVISLIGGTNEGQ
jgi:hypothetical protein